MAHPLEDIIRNAEPFLFIGDSREERFPAMSYASCKRKGQQGYYLDLGGLTESRGKESGGKVYTDPAELPDDRSDLAIIWVKPRSATNAVEVAHGLGARRIWFSFQTGHRDAVARARELGMKVVEIGRCPVHYMDGMIVECVAHTALLKLSGSYRKAPQTDPDAKRRELY
ncbi:MAG: CoA-binding protein [Deltaproteobacteria bacterium]|nr:CoA-binding protein [Deltaproteobacteria bacterium]